MRKDPTLAKINKAYLAAKKARKNAYAPYSKYHVGAALILGAEVIAGCNVENASFGATICAERNALLHAVAKHGKPRLDGIVVVTQENPPAPPCALCLQVLVEFCGKDFPIYLADTVKVREQVRLGDLLTRPFTEFKI